VDTGDGLCKEEGRKLIVSFFLNTSLFGLFMRRATWKGEGRPGLFFRSAAETKRGKTKREGKKISRKKKGEKFT